MESGGSSNSQCGDNRRVPNSGIVIEEPDVTVNTPINGSNQYVPIANVIKIMRRILPANAKIAEDAKETIQECVTEFISFITHEANENSRRECRKTITAADIISAMGTLGFDDYVEPLTVFLNKYRARDQEHSAMQHMSYHRLDTGIFQQPAAQMATHSSLQAQPTTMGYLPPLPPTGTMDGGDYVEWPQGDGYSFMGNPGGGEGSSSGKEFDPFNQF